MENSAVSPHINCCFQRCPCSCQLLWILCSLFATLSLVPPVPPCLSCHYLTPSHSYSTMKIQSFQQASLHATLLQSSETTVLIHCCVHAGHHHLTSITWFRKMDMQKEIQNLRNQMLELDSRSADTQKFVESLCAIVGTKQDVAIESLLALHGSTRYVLAFWKIACHHQRCT